MGEELVGGHRWLVHFLFVAIQWKVLLMARSIRTKAQDAELLNQLSVGNDKGLSVLYQTYRVSFFRTAVFKGVPAADAEELVDDVFVDFARQWQQFRGQNGEGTSTSLETYLTRILYNKCADVFRKLKRDSTFFEDPVYSDDASNNGECEQLGVDDETPERVVARMQVRLKLRRCLERLPSVQSDAYYLAYVEDWTMTELSELHDCSPNTIKSRLRIARESLMRCMSLPFKKGEHHVHE